MAVGRAEGLVLVAALLSAPVGKWELGDCSRLTPMGRFAHRLGGGGAENIPAVGTGGGLWPRPPPTLTSRPLRRRIRRMPT